MRIVAPVSVASGGTYVLDSSGMLAYLKNGAGGALVANILSDVTSTVYARSVNLVEVRYDFGAPSVEANRSAAKLALSQLFAAGVQEKRDNDSEFFEDVALLIAERRAQWPDPNNPKQKPRLALGDAFGLALSRRLNVEFVTADQSEIVPMQTAGFCRALFIR